MNRRQMMVMLGAAPWLAQAQTPLPTVVVTKTASCGCCRLWVHHMQSAGFPVQVNDVENLGPVKQRLGVPYGLGSCHTAEVAGYFIEGHVPADDVKRLLSERPSARGLTVPGMPLGSPGMEVPSGEVDRYQVLLVDREGQVSTWTTHGPRAGGAS